ncbi:hypothetical protein QC763_0050530 [Podospora pseudopauciseta]|uniref:Uncharacterized protein n=1 Tax=Podospora pseudopauciseta TaxID=2093780 RepID=A0ABR0HFK0_9PEZI|nr:hypothetical protein QC763_0050530 [Podospora pseudopauciseta]
MPTSPQADSTEPETTAITDPTEPPSCMACESTTRRSWASAAVPTKRSVLGVAKRLEYIFRNKEVEDLDGEFAIDAKNKWFGIDQGSDGLTFNYTDRLTDISILESNDHNAADRFPHLVSFVGNRYVLIIKDSMDRATY